MNMPSAFTGLSRDAYLNRYAAYAATLTIVIAGVMLFMWRVAQPLGWLNQKCNAPSGTLTFCDPNGDVVVIFLVVSLYLSAYLPALGGGAAWTAVRTHLNWSRWRRTWVFGAVFLAPWTQLAVLSLVALALSELNAPGLVSGGLFVAALALPIVETAGFAVWRWRSNDREPHL